MKCHEVDYEILGDDMQIVEVELDPGEPVKDAPSNPHGPQPVTTDLVRPEVTVASLEPVFPRADMPQTVGEPDAPATAVLVSPEATDDGLDPLDLFDDAPLRSGAPEASPAATSPEVAIASLDPVVLIGPIEEAKQPLLGRQLLPLIEVSNGTGRLSMAARVRRYLESGGLVIRRLTNADTFTRQ